MHHNMPLDDISPVSPPNRIKSSTEAMTNFSRAQAEHKQLLYYMKVTVEALFLNTKYSTNEPLMPTEGLLRLHTCIEQILTNGIRVVKPDKSPDLWHFIEGLNWINPLMTISIARKTTSPTIHIPYARIRQDRALNWIYENILTKKLSQKINYLVSDAEHLNNCYEITAFLQNQCYLEAFLICLQTIENNQQNLLTQIDPTLYTNKLNRLQQHRRSISHPDFSFVTKVKSAECSSFSVNNKMSKKINNETDNSNFDLTDSSQSRYDHPMDPTMFPSQRSSRNKTYNKAKRKKCKQKQFISLKLRPWSSLPDIHEVSSFYRCRSNTISQPVGIPFQKIRLTPEILALNNHQQQTISAFPYKQFPSDSGSSNGPPPTPSSHNLQNDFACPSPTDLTTMTLIKCDEIKIHLDRKFTTKQTGAEFAANFLTTTVSGVPDSVQEKSNDQTSPKKSLSPIGFFSFLPKNREAFSLLTGQPEKIESLYSSFLSGSAPGDFVNTFLPKEGEKIQRRHFEKSIMDIGSRDPSPHNEYHNQPDLDCTQSQLHHSQQPIVGQSLTSFLQTGQFSRTHSELERENAHFSVSEAMISAIEQIKWRNLEKIRAKRMMEIERLRTGARRKTRHTSLTTWDSSNKYQTIGSSISSSSSESSIISHLSTNFSNSENDDDSDYLHGLSVSSHSINDHTAYAEWGDGNLDTLSAESVALSLISKFSDKQLPRASDLLWLVSEQDVPQKMLPMPGSWAVNPDEVYKIPFTRGTRDWAPPRAQIIFTRHPPMDRKKQLHHQNQRCAGCGMKVATAYSHRFRYCEYVGKFFCTGCHRNHISIIPARVLERWNFSCYPVSVFSYRLLEQIWTFPLFRVSDLNKSLYTKVRYLSTAKVKRNQLKFIRDFIVSCRFADESKLLFDNVPNYLTNDQDIWSMSDFVRVKHGSFGKDIATLIGKCEEHVFKCDLCMARGFICEMCTRKQVIFPWQSKIKRCDHCGVCVHERCWTEDCAKCQRLRKRQQLTDTRIIN